MQEVQRIVILDFGAQYTQLIARRIREANVFCEVVPYDTSLSEIQARRPAGIILSGGPSSVLDADAPTVDPALYDLGVPVLGICYGMQLTAHLLGGRVERAAQREYGRVRVEMDANSRLLSGMSPASQCWMSHTYHVTQAPAGFKSIAHSDNCAFCAMENAERGIYCVQFHPEVTHSEEGQRVLRNFALNICGCRGDWTMAAFVQDAIKSIRERVGDGRVLLGLSGGVDSSVAAALIQRAIGERLTCVYVDHGFMRKGETEQVVDVFTRLFPVNLVAVDARARFLRQVEGVTDPEQKRKRIGAEFVAVFADEAAKIGAVDFLAQGTIYPDVIESGSVKGSAVIKSHHNVGGLPKDLQFKALLEPLRMLFKDEVRKVGEELGLPSDMVWRQPFPGPGLAIRIIGDITQEKLDIVRESDAILREEVAAAGLDRSVNQYFTVLTGIRSVGVMGDERTYDYTLAIRAVTTDDFMTVDWARLPHELLARVSARIVNEVAHVNRVVFDITTKPPASVEFE
ncbi:MAG TPA: glutamine-hydrolyzing GMP synthase [Candidatus Onthenecus intestinigallinarum]|uniref:GMP synthase [glutamine-hydrolyzing] n=1 Tax=Candidatus Onthenecus intestinigallinarum TaxID=2840875 RepID=A0A9D0ZA49_9FIRM|nr:glutamine-hydrolyzing GMP synthase [Candidatus Onthenecus intestinigallinarum]